MSEGSLMKASENQPKNSVCYSSSDSVPPSTPCSVTGGRTELKVASSPVSQTFDVPLIISKSSANPNEPIPQPIHDTDKRISSS